MFPEVSLQQARLLTSFLPAVSAEEIFALKGGTALNFFWWDMPRLSVDLDLVYLPTSSRHTFLTETGAALQRIAARINDKDPDLSMQFTHYPPSAAVTKLHVQQNEDVTVKIEVAIGQRQPLYPPVPGVYRPAAVLELGPGAIKLLSLPETCAGKCHAVLDRQLPRDLFDANTMLQSTALTPELRTAFIVDMLGQGKPIGEMLAPRRKAYGDAAWNSLEAQLPAPPDRQQLAQALIVLKHKLVDQMPIHHRDFLHTFISGHPEWSLLEMPQVQDYPAVQWRMQNLAQVSPARRQILLDKLDKVWDPSEPGDDGGGKW